MEYAWVADSCIIAYVVVTKCSQYGKSIVLVCILNTLCVFTPSSSMLLTGRLAISLAGSIKYLLQLLLLLLLFW